MTEHPYDMLVGAAPLVQSEERGELSLAYLVQITRLYSQVRDMNVMSREYSLSHYFTSITHEWAGGKRLGTGHKNVPMTRAVNQKTTIYFKTAIREIRQGKFRVYGGKPHDWKTREAGMQLPPPAKPEPNWARADPVREFDRSVESLRGLIVGSTFALDNAALLPGGLEAATEYLLGPHAVPLLSSPAAYKGTGEYAVDLIPSDDEHVPDGPTAFGDAIRLSPPGRRRKRTRDSDSEWTS